MYDYGARFYDPSISLWNSVDPLTGKYPSMSAYAYTFNNPIIFNDPTGMEGEGVDDWFKNQSTGEIVWFDSKEDNLSAGGDEWDNIGEGGFSTAGNDGSQTNYNRDGSFDNNSTGSSLEGPTVVADRYQKKGAIFDYKIEYSGSVGLKVDVGLLKFKDKGRVGFDVYGPTIRALEIKHSTNDEGHGFDVYYPGKDGEFKGVLFGAQVETPFLDLKAKRLWSTKSGFTSEFGGGAPYFEAKYSKNALKVGVQEDIGTSKSFRGISIGYKLDFRMQLKISRK